MLGFHVRAAYVVFRKGIKCLTVEKYLLGSFCAGLKLLSIPKMASLTTILVTDHSVKRKGFSFGLMQV